MRVVSFFGYCRRGLFRVVVIFAIFPQNRENKNTRKIMVFSYFLTKLSIVNSKDLQSHEDNNHAKTGFRHNAKKAAREINHVYSNGRGQGSAL